MLALRILVVTLSVVSSCATEPAVVLPGRGSNAGVPPGAASAGEAAQPPREFAPGVVSTGAEGRFSFSPDLRTIWFARHVGADRRGTIMESRRTGEGWSEPTAMPFSGTHDDQDPTVGSHGTFMVFASTRPTRPGQCTADSNLWVVYRIGDTWFEPRVLADLNSSSYDGSPSIAPDGSLWFASSRARGGGAVDLYRAPRAQSGWLAPAPVADLNSPGVESDPSVGVVGGYAIPEADAKPGAALFVTFARWLDDKGGDLFVANAAGAGWGGARPLIGGVNTVGLESAPYVSRQKLFFFLRDGRIYFADLGAVLSAR